MAKRFTVLGIDISERQIEAARQNIPYAQFRVFNITEADFPAESFHGVVSFYCFNHIPRSEYDRLFKKIAQWLKPNGLFISSFGVGDCESCLVEDWLGAPTFFSSCPKETTLRLLEEAGFSVEKAEVCTDIENNVPIDFLWVFARKL